jgi:hypothetical protein
MVYLLFNSSVLVYSEFLSQHYHYLPNMCLTMWSVTVSSHILAGRPIDILPRITYGRIYLGILLISILLTLSLQFCLCLPMFCSTGFVSSPSITSRTLKRKLCIKNDYCLKEQNRAPKLT